MGGRLHVPALHANLADVTASQHHAHTNTAGASFTPSATFSDGALTSATYLEQSGWYIRLDGNVVLFWINLAFATFVHARTGVLRITGLPIAPAYTFPAGQLLVSGFVAAGYTQIDMLPTSGQVYLETWISGSGVAISQLAAGHIASGQGSGAVRFYGAGQYRV